MCVMHSTTMFVTTTIWSVWIWFDVRWHDTSVIVKKSSDKVRPYIYLATTLISTFLCLYCSFLTIEGQLNRKCALHAKTDIWSGRWCVDLKNGGNRLIRGFLFFFPKTPTPKNREDQPGSSTGATTKTQIRRTKQCWLHATNKPWTNVSHPKKSTQSKSTIIILCLN